MKDKNGVELKTYDLIDIHQTVNGQSRFVIFGINPLDIRYAYNLCIEYEYDKENLLARCRFTGERTFEIVGKIV